MNTEEFKSIFLCLIKEDKDFREKIIETLRNDNKFIRAVGEAYRDYDINRRRDEARHWV